MRWFVAALASLLVSCVGLQPSSGAAAAPAALVTTYTYDSPYVPVAETGTQFERGPPNAVGRDTTYDAVDPWFRGALVRSGPGAVYAYTAYDHLVRVLHVNGPALRPWSELAEPTPCSPTSGAPVLPQKMESRFP